MALKDELEEKVKETFSEQWESRDGQGIPDDEDLKLSNDAVKIDGVVLYADMSASTQLVDKKKAHFAAEVYKAYLYCAARIIRAEGGEVTAYDGDRIMAVFIGEAKNSSAVKAALKINYARVNIVNSGIKAQYPESTYELKHVVGIDSSPLFVAKTGIRGSNDLVWVGRAANYAAKLCSLPSTHPTWITKEVYDMLNKNSKFDNDKKDMWEARDWIPTGRKIYRSTHWWGI